MKIQAIINCLVFLAVILSGPITQASTQTKTRIKAAYLILPAHADNAALSQDFFGPITTGSFAFEQRDTWSELYSLIRDGGVDVVFVVCQPVMDTLLSKTDHIQISKAPADNNSLLDVSGSVTAQLPCSDQSPQNESNRKTDPTVMQTNEISPVMQRIIDNRIKIIQRYATDPLIINTVRKQNAKAADMEKIKQIDKKWIAGEENKFIKSVLNSNASKFLRKKVRSNKLLYSEAFLCDRQGALVGAFPRTSDYWQGDEKKFTDCFDKGNSRVLIGPLEFDQSTKSYSVQVSVPVRNADNTIGVLIVGLKNVGQSTATKNL